MLINPQSDISNWAFFGCGTLSTRAHFMVKMEYEILCQNPGKSAIIVLNHETYGDEN